MKEAITSSRKVLIQTPEMLVGVAMENINELVMMSETKQNLFITVTYYLCE